MKSPVRPCPPPTDFAALRILWEQRRHRPGLPKDYTKKMSSGAKAVFAAALKLPTGAIIVQLWFAQMQRHPEDEIDVGDGVPRVITAYTALRGVVCGPHSRGAQRAQVHADEGLSIRRGSITSISAQDTCSPEACRETEPWWQVLPNFGWLRVFRR